MIPRSATERDVGVHHLHIDPMYAERDLGCILPMQRLAELQHGVVRGIDNAVDRSQPGQLEPPLDLVWTGSDVGAANQPQDKSGI